MGARIWRQPSVIASAGVTNASAALAQLRPYDLSAIARVRLDAGAEARRLATAVGAGLGVASGAVVFDADRARLRAGDGPVILVRQDIATDDVAGIAAAVGVLTAVGGRTSHAAVVACHLGKVCVVGCGRRWRRSTQGSISRTRCMCAAAGAPPGSPPSIADWSDGLLA